MFKKHDQSIGMSVPKSYELHGVKVRKLPIAKYIAVLREMDNLPALLLGGIYPDINNTSELIDRLLKLDRNEVLSLIGGLLKVVPEELCKTLSSLLDIPAERLLDPDCPDPLSLSELADIIQAFWKINDMSDFLKTVSSLKARTRSTTNTGSNAGSQSPKA